MLLWEYRENANSTSSYDSVIHTAPGDHRVRVWSQSGHLPARISDFRPSTKVPVSRDLWPWLWAWAHPECRL